MSSNLTIHHLQRSQSERIVWLLEELDLPYDLVIHKRDPVLAPPALKALHEQGTAPLLVDGDLKLPECMAIATYLLNKNAGPKASELAPSPESPIYAEYLYWLHYVASSLESAIIHCLFVHFDKSLPDDQPVLTYSRVRVQKCLNYVEKRIGEKKYLAGDQFTLGDIMVLWLFTTLRVFLPYSLSPYPNIQEYVKRLTDREGYKRAMDKGEHGLPILNGAEPGEQKAVF